MSIQFTRWRKSNNCRKAADSEVDETESVTSSTLSDLHYDILPTPIQDNKAFEEDKLSKDSNMKEHLSDITISTSC